MSKTNCPECKRELKTRRIQKIGGPDVVYDACAYCGWDAR